MSREPWIQVGTAGQTGLVLEVYHEGTVSQLKLKLHN